MTIEVSWSPTEADHLVATRLIFARSLRRPRVWRGALIFSLIYAVIGLAFTSDTGWLWERMVVVVLMAALGVLVFMMCIAINYALLPYCVRRLLRQEKLDHSAWHWRWSDEGIGNANSQSTLNLRWDQLIGWAAGKRSLLFYISEAKILFVGTRVLTQDQIATITALAARHGVKRW